jgi:hypothetical protein
MLTTLTTVLGLAPLLYETSQQAAFLRPTVITLVYGLGFGMLLVLVVVPALIAIQHDLRRNITALRRSARVRGLWLPMGTAVLALAAWLGLTMGWPVVTGQTHPILASLTIATTGGGLALFLIGALGIVVVLYVMSLLVTVIRRPA